MPDLRSRIIRLAYENAPLRAALLPLLKETGQAMRRKTASRSPADRAWPEFTILVNRDYKIIQLSTYLPHSEAERMPAFIRKLENYFDKEVRPRLLEIGFTVQDEMGVNSGVGEPDPRDPVYGMLIVAWKLEEMAEDRLVEVVKEAFEKLKR